MRRCPEDEGFKTIMRTECAGLEIVLEGAEIGVTMSILAMVAVLNTALADAPEDGGLPERLAVVLHEKTKGDPHAWCGLYSLLGIIQDLRNEREPPSPSPGIPSDGIPSDGGGILG